MTCHTVHILIDRVDKNAILLLFRSTNWSICFPRELKERLLYKLQTIATFSKSILSYFMKWNKKCRYHECDKNVFKPLTNFYKISILIFSQQT